MSGINGARVLVGGLAAGLVFNAGEALLNLVVLGDQMTAAMAKMNLAPPAGAAIGVFIVFGFAIGIVTVWLYAAVRPRLGPGPKTALLVGLVVWFFGYLYTSVGLIAMGMFPLHMILIALVWGLAEVLIAAVVGASLYREA